MFLLKSSFFWRDQKFVMYSQRSCQPSHVILISSVIKNKAIHHSFMLRGGYRGVDGRQLMQEDLERDALVLVSATWRCGRAAWWETSKHECIERYRRLAERFSFKIDRDDKR